ncbi:unnamed protein product, partial [Phaeothamnion confervicola]
LGDRLGVVITLLLAAGAFQAIVSSYIPTLPYLTWLDQYVLLAFFPFALVTLAVVIFYGIHQLGDPDAALVLNNIFLGALGTVWIVCHILLFFTEVNENGL